MQKKPQKTDEKLIHGRLKVLVHPERKIFTQKVSYSYQRKNNNFSSRNIFHVCLKELIFCPKKTFPILS